MKGMSSCMIFAQLLWNTTITTTNNLVLGRSRLLASEASPRFSYISTSFPLCPPSSAVTSVLLNDTQLKTAVPELFPEALRGCRTSSHLGIFTWIFLLTPVAQEIYNWSYLPHPICSLLFIPYFNQQLPFASLPKPKGYLRVLSHPSPLFTEF